MFFLLNNLDFYIVIPSTIFFFSLFQGVFTIQNINKFFGIHPWIAIGVKILGYVLFFGLLFYLCADVCDAAGPEGKDLPSAEVKVTGDNHNTLSINNSTFNIPDSIATGLTNLGTGAAVAAGLKAGASIAKTSGLPPTAKIGVLAATGILGGATATLASGANSIFQKKIDSALVKSVKSNPTTPTSPPTSNTGSSTAFSVEPSGADIDTVLTFLNSYFILECCILYLLLSLMIFYLSNMALENKLNLIFIKNIFGERFYNLLIKSLSYAGKYNRIWMFITWVLSVFGSIIALLVSYFILNNIDIISEIVQQSKPK